MLQLDYGLLLIVLLIALPLQAADFVIDPQTSGFVAVTTKAGAISRLGHDHLIAAKDFQAVIEANPDDLSQMALTISFRTSGLKVDDPQLAKTWFERVKAAGILDQPFHEQSESNQRKITKAMTGSKQLDIKKFPEIRAELKQVRVKESKHGELTFSHELVMDVTIKGKTVEKIFAANLSVEAGQLSIEALSELSFSEFGMKAYSIMFGAIANADVFHILVNLKAKAVG